MSYTTFAYADLKIKTSKIGLKGTVCFSFTVTNTGPRAGKETPQVYFRDRVSSTTTPVMRLVRFQKVALNPGKSRKLNFEIPVSELALWNDSMQRVVEPGEFDILVGSSAEDVHLRGTFTVKKS